MIMLDLTDPQSNFALRAPLADAKEDFLAARAYKESSRKGNLAIFGKEYQSESCYQASVPSSARHGIIEECVLVHAQDIINGEDRRPRAIPSFTDEVTVRKAPVRLLQVVSRRILNHSARVMVRFPANFAVNLFPFLHPIKVFGATILRMLVRFIGKMYSREESLVKKNDVPFATPHNGFHIVHFSLETLITWRAKELHLWA
ncbi:hypothetical protein F5050DRAFT_1862438 [Lentinula boryana]|uniref:Uncharacterized protein n=1 Tax=Lentinula boryana TaxID=40481 RepID=A0ABQ8PZP2_9AGAR|nr:hypothetical protein F5050DRAFT_1862438 [Lentinula boryana]